MSTSKLSVLCVDDESSVIEALTRVLRKDFEVLSANNAEDALKIIHQNPNIAIVLSDYRMPGMNGVEFLQQVKRLIPNAVRAILSGQMDTQQISNAINNAEIHRFILKPWDNEYLTLQMFEALQTHNRIAENKRLWQMSITDPITGLTNHRYFQEKIKEEYNVAEENNSKVSLLMIDVDHFKSFNDRYGHPEGDRLLALVADNIKAVTGEYGIASRYGGEEFAVVLPNLDKNQAYEVGENLRKAIEKQAFLGPYSKPVYVTISLGVSTYPETSESSKSMIEDADKALYDSKNNGRNKTSMAGS